MPEPNRFNAKAYSTFLGGNDTKTSVLLVGATEVALDSSGNAKSARAFSFVHVPSDLQPVSSANLSYSPFRAVPDRDYKTICSRGETGSICYVQVPCLVEKQPGARGDHVQHGAWRDPCR